MCALCLEKLTNALDSPLEAPGQAFSSTPGPTAKAQAGHGSTGRGFAAGSRGMHLRGHEITDQIKLLLLFIVICPYLKRGFVLLPFFP